MFQDISIAYNSARRGHKRPVMLAAITSITGNKYIYAMQAPTAAERGSRGLDLFDGRRDVGSGKTFGSFPVVIWEARVEQFGGLEKSLAVNTRDILASLRQAEIGAYSITCDNHDGHFSELLQEQSFLTCQFELRQGFAGLTWGEMPVLFTAEIVEEHLSSEKLRLLIESENQLGSPNIGGFPGNYAGETFEIPEQPYIYIADNGNMRIQAVSETHQFVLQFKSGAGSLFEDIPGIAFDPSGDLYIADNNQDYIQKFDSNGNFLLVFGSTGGGNGEFFGLWSITSDTLGNLYVVDSGNNRIQKFDSSGNYLTQWGSFGSGDGEFRTPRSITLDSLGNLYVTDEDNHRVQKFSSPGVYSLQRGVNGTGNAEFSGPMGITSDSSDNLYVVDTGNNRIQKFDSSLTYDSQWGSFGAGTTEFDDPLFITCDKNNRLYVTDSGNNRIQVFDSSGNFVTMFGFSGIGAGEFDYPTGIAIR